MDGQAFTKSNVDRWSESGRRIGAACQTFEIFRGVYFFIFSFSFAIVCRTNAIIIISPAIRHVNCPPPVVTKRRPRHDDFSTLFTANASGVLARYHRSFHTANACVRTHGNCTSSRKRAYCAILEVRERERKSEKWLVSVWGLAALSGTRKRGVIIRRSYLESFRAHPFSKYLSSRSSSKKKENGYSSSIMDHETCSTRYVNVRRSLNP